MDAPPRRPDGYELQSRDSTYWAERVQFAHWGGLAVEQKVRLIEDWNEAVAELQAESIRRDHPQAPLADRERIAAEARYGREFVQRFAALDRNRSVAR